MSDAKRTKKIGVAVAVGAGVGAALFAVTNQPGWIGLGAGAGAAFGAVAGRREGGGSA